MYTARRQNMYLGCTVVQQNNNPATRTTATTSTMMIMMMIMIETPADDADANLCDDFKNISPGEDFPSSFRISLLK